MNEKRSRNVLIGAGVAIALALGIVTHAAPAIAEPLSVSGNDAYYDESLDNTVDILAVTGERGNTVYVDVLRGGEVIASHLPFTLDDENAQADENGDMVGLVNISFNGGAFSPDETYEVKVYGDRAEQNLLYAGQVVTLFAQYDDGAMEPLAVRTLAEGEVRAFVAPQTLEHNGITYELASADPQVVDGRQAYAYKESADTPDSVTARVQYYDIENAEGDPIKVEEYTLAKGASQNVAIETVIASDQDGALYRTLQLTNNVTLSYPGTTQYAIMCKRLSDEWGSVGSFFNATINYVDADGTNLGVKDKVVVNKPYSYTPPTNIYVEEAGNVRAYTLASPEDSVLRLEPGMAEGAAEFNIEYGPVSDDAPRTWTVVLENGSVAPKDANRVIDRITYRGAPGTTAMHETSKKIKVDGVDYVPSASAQDSYEHVFGVADMDVEQVIYYVPDGYVEPEAYEVAVKYVNIATNEVIASETYTASPSMRSDLEIESPATFTADGVEWVRLDGQEKAIRHGFYSKARSYTVYYRDVNDDLHSTTVIRTVRVEYIDEEGNTVTRPTSVVDNGTTDNGTTDLGTTVEEVVVEDGGTVPSYTTRGGNAAGGEGTQGTNAGGGGGAGNGVTDTGLQTGEDLRAIDGEDGNTLVDSEGEKLEEVRIADDETPLAGPSANNGGSSDVTAMAAGIGTGVAVATGGLLFFVFKRRKQGKGKASDNDATV